MNIALLSEQVSGENDLTGKVIQRLLLKRGNKEIAYIPSQSDASRHYFNLAKEYYRSLGLSLIRYFDLDKEYDTSKFLSLINSGAIHLSGGSTYHFLENLKKRNFLLPLQQYALQGGIIIGVSAGAILMTPGIQSSILCGDPVIDGLDTNSLHLVDWEFIPHFVQSRESRNRIEAYSKTVSRDIYACPDGAGVFLFGQGPEFVGDVEICKDGFWFKP